LSVNLLDNDHDLDKERDCCCDCKIHIFDDADHDHGLEEGIVVCLELLHPEPICLKNLEKIKTTSRKMMMMMIAGDNKLDYGDKGHKHCLTNHIP
jgi:hypothetical protein